MKVVLRIGLLYLLTAKTLSQEVETTKGKIQGQTVSVLGKDVDVFYKIPYAKPPTGNLRFKYPQTPDSWKPEVKDGRNPAPSCIQSNIGNFFQEDFRNLPDYFSEDCLYLTLVRPANASGGLTSMVWIHGGGYVGGSPRSIVTEGYFMAAEMNVIVVSVAYRLGALGFAYLSPETIPGNMGMMDQNMALQWVKDNIAAFGGDPNKITAVGESAGATSVALHLLSPLSRDLFERVILQSGSPTSSWSFRTTADVKAGTSMLASALKCQKSNDVETTTCLNNLDIQDILNAQTALLATGLITAPVIDGYFLPDHPETLLAKGEYQKKSILHGVNTDEGSVIVASMVIFLLNVTIVPEEYTPTDLNYKYFIGNSIASQKPFPMALNKFYDSFVSEDNNVTRLDVSIQIQGHTAFGCPAVKFGSSVFHSNDVYLYKYDHRTSVTTLPDWMGVVHSYEIEYVFGFPLNDSVGYTQEEVDLGRAMMTYWSNFAKTGDPNSPENVPVAWPKYDNETMAFLNLDTGSKLSTKHKLFHHECVFINDILPMIPSEQLPGTTQAPPCLNGGRNLKIAFALVILVLGSAIVSVHV